MFLLWLPPLILAAGILLLLAGIHLGFRPPRHRERGDPGALGLPYQELRIPTVAGKTLFAWLLPRPNAAGTIVILHGWGGNAEMMLPLALPFYRAGLNVILPDARCHGRSDGDSFSSLPRFAEDLGRVVNWLGSRNGPGAGTERVILLGHSVGAGACLLEASRRRDIAAVISIAAFAHPEWMMRRYLGRWHLPTPLVSLILRYVQWVIGHRFEEIAPIRTICAIPCPVLMVHGREDRTVPVTDMRAIQARCERPHISFLEIAGADHDSVEKIESHAGQLLAFLRRQAILPAAKDESGGKTPPPDH